MANMKLALRIDSPQGGSFNPQDVLRGVLEIRGAEIQNLSQISTSLTGQVVADVSVTGLGANLGTVSGTLFKLTKTLPIAALVPSQDENGLLVYTCPVEIQFPRSPYETDGSATELPSSLSILTADIRIRAEYFITATVKRRVLGTVPKSTSTRQVLPFVANTTTILQPKAALPLTMPPNIIEFDDKTDTQMTETSLPPYAEVTSPFRPMVQIKLSQPRPPVLVCGQTAPLGLVIHVPLGRLDRNTAFIRFVAVNFVQTTAMQIGHTTRKAVQILHTYTTSGAMEIVDELSNIDMGLGGKLSLSSARPTCKGPRLRVQHSIEVEVGISFGVTSKIQFLRTSTEVTVLDAPPVYSTAIGTSKRKDYREGTNHSVTPLI